MKDFPISPKEMIISLWRNRSLIATLTRREVAGRYRGSFLGLAWSFFNPILMLVIYTFVFSIVFKARWGISTAESKTDFAMLLFVGLIVHGLFADCVNRAPGLILANVNYVKKVIFPLEILPWISLGSALFHTAVSIAVLLFAKLVMSQQVPWTIVLFPFILLPLVFSTMGFSWFLAALGVYVRDVGQITGIFTTILLFVSPIFYPVSALPTEYQGLMQLNPLTYILEEGRNTLIFGKLPDIGRCGVMFAVGILIAWVGFAWFQKTRKGFADVL